MKIVIKSRSLINEGLLTEVSFEDAIANKDKAIRKMAKAWVYHRQNTDTPSVMPGRGREWNRWGLSVENIIPMLDNAIMARIPDDIEEKQKALALMWMLRIGRSDILNTEHFVESAANISILYGQGFGQIGEVDDQTYYDRTQIEKFFHYNRFMKVRDLNKIPTMRRLLRIVNAAESDIAAYQEKQAYLDADEGTEVLREDTEWKIAILHNKGAACKLGKGTGWCTAAPGLNYFKEYYKEDDPLFYFEERDEAAYQKDLEFYRDTDRDAETTPDRRYFAEIYQFHYGSKQFMDSDDMPISPDKATEMTSLLVRTLGERVKEFPSLETYYNQNKLLMIVTDPSSDKSDLDYASNEIMKNPDQFSGQSRGLEASWYMMRIATHPNVSPNTLRGMANYYYGSDFEGRWGWQYVMREVAANSKTPSDILDYMADTQDIKVRDAVAQNPSTSSNTLRMLARGGDPASVAARKRASLEEIIRKTGKKFCLYSKSKGKDGKRRKLGCYPSRAGAKKREKQVQYFKHKG